MKKKFINECHIEGFVYDHNLESKVSGPNSANPNTEYITGTLNVATDNAVTNIVPVHFTYVTATTKAGGQNATYKVLKGIIDGTYPTYLQKGAEAAKVRIDTALNLNEFYDKEDKLVSAKRNEGGFVHLCDALNEKEDMRNTFKCDILIYQVLHIDADEEKNTPEKAIVKGYTFDFRNSLLPMEFTALSSGAIAYFESLEASQKNPTVTQIWGNQVSTTVVTKKTEENAFGNPYVTETKSNRKDFVITGANKVPYEWDDESVLTAAELNELLANRETTLASIKQRQEDYKNSKSNTTVAAVAAAVNNSGSSEFQF